jgi:hypothetical protein
MKRKLNADINVLSLHKLLWGAGSSLKGFDYLACQVYRVFHMLSQLQGVSPVVNLINRSTILIGYTTVGKGS